MVVAALRRRLPASLSRFDLLVALLAGVTGVAGSFAVAGYTREFLVAPIDAVVVRSTPGELVAFMIQNVGEEAHLLHIALAVGIAVGLLAGVTLLALLVARRVDRPDVRAGVATVLAGGLAWALAAVVTAQPLLGLGAALPVAVVTAAGAVGRPDPEYDPARRTALAAGATALGALAVAVGLGRFRPEDGQTAVQASDTTGLIDEETDEETATMIRDAASRELDIAGDVPGLLSTFDEFYNVDIAQFDPDVAADDWQLTVTGEVGEDRTIDFAALQERPTERRYVTLRCVGESLNGHKCDTAVWTGTPLGPILDEADPEGNCGCAMLHAADGYFVQFPVAALRQSVLAWGMNGRPLPQSHGHPVRVLVPGHWGETNVKWVEKIELLEEEMDGYWEQRGWHGTGPVNTVAKLWSDTVLEDGRIEVAGHAYAGTRGIDRVEVSIDGGETWTDADLSEPLPAADVWRQWRYVFEPDGTHEVVVRATDGEGTLQSSEEARSFPSGATGWVRKTVSA